MATKDESDWHKNITSVKSVRFVRHHSAAKLARSWFTGLARSARVSLDGFDSKETLAFVEMLRENRAWAYSSVRTREVHYWFSTGTPLQQRMHILAHELGHIVAEWKNWRRAYAPRDELRADIFGAVAALAMLELRSKRKAS